MLAAITLHRLATDLTGQVYERLTVLRPVRQVHNGKEGKRSQFSTYWECQCECGNIIEANGKDLIRGHKKSCGCITNLLDMVGKRFGRLSVERLADKRANDKGAIWECRCDCGNTKDIAGHSLRRGLTQSCGCLHDEATAQRTTQRWDDWRTEHGIISTPEELEQRRQIVEDARLRRRGEYVPKRVIDLEGKRKAKMAEIQARREPTYAASATRQKELEAMADALLNEDADRKEAGIFTDRELTNRHYREVPVGRIGEINPDVNPGSALFEQEREDEAMYG